MKVMVAGPFSHLARARFTRRFTEAGIEHRMIRFSLGMRGIGYIIPIEALPLAREMGATKSKIQWSHLNNEAEDN